MKEVAVVYKRKEPAVLVNDINEIVLDAEEIKTVWEQYISELFQDDERPNLEIEQGNKLRRGPPIPKDEMKKAEQQSKNIKPTEWSAGRNY